MIIKLYSLSGGEVVVEVWPDVLCQQAVRLVQDLLGDPVSLVGPVGLDLGLGVQSSLLVIAGVVPVFGLTEQKGQNYGALV